MHIPVLEEIFLRRFAAGEFEPPREAAFVLLPQHLTVIDLLNVSRQRIQDWSKQALHLVCKGNSYSEWCHIINPLCIHLSKMRHCTTFNDCSSLNSFQGSDHGTTRDTHFVKAEPVHITQFQQSVECHLASTIATHRFMENKQVGHFWPMSFHVQTLLFIHTVVFAFYLCMNTSLCKIYLLITEYTLWSIRCLPSASDSQQRTEGERRV